MLEISTRKVQMLSEQGAFRYFVLLVLGWNSL